MKRIFALVVAALMSTMMLNAKTVRGYVSDVDGNPVVGVKMVVKCADMPNYDKMTTTDEEGHFLLKVSDNVDTDDLVQLFAQQGVKVVQYWNTSSGLRIVVEAPRAANR